MQSITEMTSEEKIELKDEVLDVITDYVKVGDFTDKGNDFFTSSIEKIRLKHDISELEMALYMSVYLDIVIKYLEEKNG